MTNVTISALDERTFRIEAPDGRLVWGGLGPDSLALDRVVIGPVHGWRAEEPSVFYVTCNSEAGTWVCDVSYAGDIAPLGPVYDAPLTCLEEEAAATEQLPTLRAGVDECLAYAERHAGLDDRLCSAALQDRAAGRGERVRAVAQDHLESTSSAKGVSGSVIVGTGEQVRVPTARLADAVERITGHRPHNHVQVRTLMRRWARRWSIPRRR